MLDPELDTSTSEQQRELEERIAGLYHLLVDLDPARRNGELELLRDKHVRYLQTGLGQLPPGFAALDASRPWICYWLLHSLALLHAPLPPAITAADVVHFLRCCAGTMGGFGGGPCQLPHLAPTYAAVSALVTLGTPEAFASLDRPALSSFLQRMAVPPERGGGFTMHEGENQCCAL